MEISVASVTTLLVLLISVSATYNAFLLRGGKLAWSQVLIVMGMVSLLLSLVLPRFLPDPRIIRNANLSDLLFIVGFIFLLLASVKLHTALK
ncbi:hypothetical protein A3F02_02340 [Candidatus Curtissbacteria bacterium RIFCSPHIGHO2_12_FULL_38_9b]|uniref:Uncharacterized protein n=1 Tax=Candidatus Curtissbacteria bacterium RIFCSPHIGHO2_12_FULL_38_9b TaxID=1797720 RepID=A0A1F5GWK6_9BACT|nr:MAG: hypothetical protein A3F02_02340 [Candidatus Curtissbacteria bacterium RIFCSPHIGHO2_12_FULL_38_9b]